MNRRRSTEEIVDALDRLEPESPSASAFDTAGNLIEELAAEPDGLKMLIERYGGSPNPVLIQPIGFFLARKAGEREFDPTLGALFWRLFTHLSCAESWSRVNLCTAITRLVIHDRLPRPDEAERRRLYEFFADALVGAPELQAAAIPSLADVIVYGPLDTLSTAEKAALRDRAQPLLHSPDEQVLSAMEHLKGLLDETV